MTCAARIKSRGQLRRRATILVVAFAALLTSCVERDADINRPINDSTNPARICTDGATPREPVDADVLAAFPTCGDGTAHYIPDFLIPEGFRTRLAAGPEDMLCVPDVFAADPAYTPIHCISLLGVPGACLPAVLPEVADAKVPLPTANCAWNERCVPCVDPETMLETGACDLGAMACEPPVQYHDCQDLAFDPQFLANFSSCCTTGYAHCAAKDFVIKKDDTGAVDPASQRLADQLADCDNGNGYCVPDAFLGRGGRFHPVACESLGGREGRCISTCIPDVASQMDSLPQANCLSDERCAPCYDPRTGAATGVCSIGRCDEPKDPPQTFESCGVNDDAFCIPASLIPAADRKRFDNRGCGTGCRERGTLCIPRKVMDHGETFTPATCKSKAPGFLGGLISALNGNFSQMGKFSEGRCLSKCIPDIRATAERLKQDGCDENEVCVPCYDPRQAGRGLVPTGACNR